MGQPAKKNKGKKDWSHWTTERWVDRMGVFWGPGALFGGRLKRSQKEANHFGGIHEEKRHTRMVWWRLYCFLVLLVIDLGFKSRNLQFQLRKRSPPLPTHRVREGIAPSIFTLAIRGSNCCS